MIDDNCALFNAFESLRRFAASVAVLLFVLCTGCGSNPFYSNPYPPVPESQRNIDVDYDYVLGPGDSVDIFVWGNEELSTLATIRPDGKLTTHLVEDIQASGKTSTQLARDIEVAGFNRSHAIGSHLINELCICDRRKQSQSAKRDKQVFHPAVVFYFKPKNINVALRGNLKNCFH